jgi:uncharacterized protein YcfJ
MESITTTAKRIHPLMAAAAASVIIVSLAGTAAITGVLPSSHSAPEAPMPTTQVAPAYAGAVAPTAAPAMAAQGLQPVPVGYAQPAGPAYAQPAAYAQQAYPVQAAVQPAPAPVVIEKTIIKEVPAKQAPRPHTVHTSYARHEAPAYYEPAPRPAPQPNYVGIGTGAVIGGLIGNQVGSGNGRKLATVAGIIGGGMLGNQMINR